jgi:phospholipid/cholesterol/gamma-HCH transport system permease protein
MISITKNFFELVGFTLIMLRRALREVPSLFHKPRRLLDQCFFMGNATVGLVILLSFAIGAVLALQTGYSMTEFGAKEYIGSIVGLSMVRELGPVMTAILVVGRIGSATTAEIASMRVYKEVDALTTMNIAPERLLVTPRLVAIMIVMPFLTLMSIVSGWIGGAVVASYTSWIDLGRMSYFTTLARFVSTSAITQGVLKGEFFGISVVLICCAVGLKASGGPRQIGESVTKAVVISIIYILFTDYFVTDVLLKVLK